MHNKTVFYLLFLAICSFFQHGDLFGHEYSGDVLQLFGTADGLLGRDQGPAPLEAGRTLCQHQ